MLFKNYNQLIKNGQTPILQKKRKDALDILTSALESVNPYKSVKRLFNKNKLLINSEVFDLSIYENIYLVGFGKASVGMSQAVCDSISIKKGVVITNILIKNSLNDSIDFMTGEHPIPNNGSVRGTEKILELMSNTHKKDLVLVLISGGGSALLCKPRIGLKDLQTTTNLLLKSGANISEINTIRKHLSIIKGGQLARFTDSTIMSLIISDIVNDPMEFIASGPTHPDSTTFFDAKQILEKYNLIKEVPKSVLKIFNQGINGLIPETPKKGDPVFNNVRNFIIANIENLCNQAIVTAKNLGYDTTLYSTTLTGEAREISSTLIKNAKDHENSNNILISGGETTVTIKGDGEGGRNQELVLAGVENIANSEMVILSFATDGIDGKSVAAGAIADGFTCSRAEKKKLNPEHYLKMNNSFKFFNQLNDVLITGPTGTNVMDIQLIIN